MEIKENAVETVPAFTDEEFIAFLTEQGFWTEGLLSEEVDEVEA